MYAPLGEDGCSLCQQLLMVCSSSSRGGAWKVPSICLGMSTGVTMLLLFRWPNCWDFTDAAFLSYTGNSLSRQLGPLALILSPSLRLWCSLSLGYWGCVWASGLCCKCASCSWALWRPFLSLNVESTDWLVCALPVLASPEVTSLCCHYPACFFFFFKWV